MEDYYNYENLLGSTQSAEENSPNNRLREQLQQQLEDKKRDILLTSEGLSTPMIVEGLRGIGKSAFSKAKSKVEEEGGETAKSIMNKLDEAKGDFEDGGIKKVLSRQVNNVKNKLKSKAETEIKKRLGLGSDEEEFKLQNLKKQAEQKARDAYTKARGGTSKVEEDGTELNDFSSVDGAVETNIGKQSIGGLDKDIQDSLSKNPTNTELNEAILKQSNRNSINDLKEGKKLPTKDLGDDMTRTQTEGGRIRLPKLEKKLTRGERKEQIKIRKKKINDKFDDLSDEDKSNVLKEVKQAKDSTQTFRKSGQDALTQQENDVAMKENIMDNYTERQNQLTQSAEQSTSPPTEQPSPPTEQPSAPTDEPTPPTTKPKVNAEEDAVKGFKDTEKVAGDVEELGGGVEDPITDVISLILGGIGLFGGIKASEKAKEAMPPPTTISNVSNQIGVN